MPQDSQLVNVVIDLEDLKVLCAWWQKKLRLQDWEVVLEIVHPGRLDGAAAKTYWKFTKKVCVIRFADPAHIEFEAWSVPLDMEVSLVTNFCTSMGLRLTRFSSVTRWRIMPLRS